MINLKRLSAPKEIISYLTLGILGVIVAVGLAVISGGPATAQNSAPPAPRNFTYKANPHIYILSWEQDQLDRVSHYEGQIQESPSWQPFCVAENRPGGCESAREGTPATSLSYYIFPGLLNPAVNQGRVRFRIRAVGSDGQTSPWAVHTISETPSAEPPLDITARHYGDHIVVNWRHNHPDLPAERQIVRWKRADETRWKQTVLTTSDTYRIATTTSGVGYVVEVANEYDKRAPFSQPVSKSKSEFGRAAFPLPPAPINLSDEVNPRRMVLSWDHGQPENVIAHYDLRFSGVGWKDYCPENPNQAKCPKLDTTRIFNVAHMGAIRWSIRIRAVGFDGQTSEWVENAFDVPRLEPPLDIQARRDSDHIEVTWRHNHPSMPAEKQIVRWQAEDETDWTEAVVSTSDNYRISGISSDVGYTVEVANKYEGGPPLPVSVESKSEFGRAVFQPLPEPVNLRHEANPFRLALSWDHDRPEIVKHYNLQIGVGNGRWSDYCPENSSGRQCPKPDTTRVFEVVPADDSETGPVRIRAIGFDGQTSDWVEYTPTIPQVEPPLDIRARFDGDQIEVTWRHNHPSMPADKQIVRWKVSHESSWTEAVVTTTEVHRISKTGSDGGGYVVEVANEYEGNPYPARYESRSEFGRAVFPPPPAPSNLRHEANPFRLVLRWEQDQVEAIRYYDVQTYVDAFDESDWLYRYCYVTLYLRCPASTTSIGLPNYSVSATEDVVLNNRIRAVGLGGSMSDWVYYKAEMPTLAPPLDITARLDGEDIVVSWRHNHPNMPAPRQIVRWKTEDEEEWNQHTVGPPAVSDDTMRLYSNQALWEQRYSQAQSGEYRIAGTGSGVGYTVEVANEYDHHQVDRQMEARSEFGRATFLPVVQFEKREQTSKERTGDRVKTLKVELDKPVVAPLTLKYTVHSDGSDVKLPPLPGRAEQGADFATEGLCEIQSPGVCSGSLTIPTGSSEAAIAVNIKVDGVSEPAEVFKVRIEPGDGYTVGKKNTVRVTIRRNDK